MTIISLDLNDARQTARILSSSGNTVDDVCGQLHQQWSALSATWEGHSKHEAEAEVRAGLNQGRRCAEFTRERGAKLTQIADRFHAADENEPFPVQAMIWGAQAALAMGIGAPGQGGQPQPSDFWGLAGGLLASGVATVQNGINQLYHTGEAAWNGLMDFAQDTGAAAIKASDQFIAGGLNQLLPQTLPGSKETLKFEIKGDVTIPGLETGAPSSYKLVGAKSGELIHNEDGTYTLVLKTEGGGGIKEPLVEAEGKLKLGTQEFKAGADVSLEGLAMGETEVAFKFDPNKPGDMTKMAAFTATLGLAAVTSTTLGSGLIPVGDALVGPALFTLKDNLDSVKIGAGVDGRAEADVSALVKLAGVEGEVSGRVGEHLFKNESGQWQSSSYLELGGEGKISWLGNEAGVKCEASLEQITNLETGQPSSRVTLELQAQTGKQLELKDIEKYVPQSALSDLKINSDIYGKVTLEYTLDSPAESIVDSLMSENGPNLQPIINNSQVVISGTVGAEAGLGLSGNVGAVSQGGGLGGEVNMARETEVTLYDSEHP
jgi:uncharacterized protein YukE